MSIEAQEAKFSWLAIFIIFQADNDSDDGLNCTHFLSILHAISNSICSHFHEN